VSKGDLLVERGARWLQGQADRAAARGDGIGEWLSDELRNDAAFLRKLKPSLVAARAKGAASTNGAPAEPPPPPPEAPTAQQPRAQAEPKPKAKKKPKPRGSGGPPALAIVGAALVAGIVLAKVVDWRGHAHPRD
jgi:cell division septation protein DedD